MVAGKSLYSFVDETVIAKRLDGDMAAFENLFNSFIIRHRFINDDIERLLVAGEYEAALILTHSVVGSAAMVGLNSLEHTAQALERSISIHDEVAINVAIKEFSKILEDIIQEISE